VLGGVVTDGAHAGVFSVEHASESLPVDADSHEVTRVKGAIDETFNLHASQIRVAWRLRRLQTVLVQDVDDVVLQEGVHVVLRLVVLVVKLVAHDDRQGVVVERQEQVAHGVQVVVVEAEGEVAVVGVILFHPRLQVRVRLHGAVRREGRRLARCRIRLWRATATALRGASIRNRRLRLLLLASRRTRGGRNSAFGDQARLLDARLVNVLLLFFRSHRLPAVTDHLFDAHLHFSAGQQAGVAKHQSHFARKHVERQQVWAHAELAVRLETPVVVLSAVPPAHRSVGSVRSVYPVVVRREAKARAVRVRRRAV
jgi:hypothetical protein